MPTSTNVSEPELNEHKHMVIVLFHFFLEMFEPCEMTELSSVQKAHIILTGIAEILHVSSQFSISTVHKLSDRSDWVTQSSECILVGIYI